MVDLLQSDPSEGLDDDAIQIVIAPDSAGDRLDRVLAAHLPDVSRARIQALMAQGALMFDGKIISDVSAKAKAGTYVLVMPAPIAALPAPENLPPPAPAQRDCGQKPPPEHLARPRLQRQPSRCRCSPP
jgi:23S rRNA pseudouridine1911/1915/1917 synthase